MIWSIIKGCLASGHLILRRQPLPVNTQRLLAVVCGTREHPVCNDVFVGVAAACISIRASDSSRVVGSPSLSDNFLVARHSAGIANATIAGHSLVHLSRPKYPELFDKNVT